MVLGAPLKSLLNQFGIDTDKAATSFLSKEVLNTIPKDERTGLVRDISRSSNQISSIANLSMFPLMQILKKAGNFNILSTPQITALDNVKASIEVGENAPVGLTSTSGTGSVAVQNSVERQNVTIRLGDHPQYQRGFRHRADGNHSKIQRFLRETIHRQ